MQEKSLEALERRNKVINRSNFKEGSMAGSKINVVVNPVRNTTLARCHVSKTESYRC